MLTKQRLALVVFVIGAIAVSYGLGFIPAHIEICDHAKEDGTQYCSTYRLIPGILAYIEAHDGLVTAIATIVIAAFTRSLYAATAGLKNSTDKLWEAGKNQLRVTHRAYLSVSPAGVISAVDESRFGGYVRIKNVGQAIARDITIKIWARDYLDQFQGQLTDSDALLETDNPFQPISAILPNTEIIRESLNRINDIDPAHGGSGFVFVWGEVRYDDGFRKARHTLFCHRYEIARFDGSFNPGCIRECDGRYHQHGNDAD